MLSFETKPRVVVLLAAYNGMRWIEEQVDSILKQENVDVTLLISVDLSDDETYHWCKTKEKTAANIVVLPYGERFGSAGKNFYRLIKDADFSGVDYVSLSDQDDIWLPEKLFSAMEVLKEKQCDAYSSDVLAFWEDGKKERVIKSQPQRQYDHLFEAAGPGCTYVLTVSSFIRFKQFLENNEDACQFKLHDWLIYAFYRNSGLIWFISDKPLMLYRQHESNQVGFNKGFRAYKTRLKQVKTKAYRQEVEKLVSLLDLDNEINLNRYFFISNFRDLRRRIRDACALLVFSLVGWF